MLPQPVPCDINCVMLMISAQYIFGAEIIKKRSMKSNIHYLLRSWRVKFTPVTVSDYITCQMRTQQPVQISDLSFVHQLNQAVRTFLLTVKKYYCPLLGFNWVPFWIFHLRYNVESFGDIYMHKITCADVKGWAPLRLSTYNKSGLQRGGSLPSKHCKNRPSLFKIILWYSWGTPMLI